MHAMVSRRPAAIALLFAALAAAPVSAESAAPAGARASIDALHAALLEVMKSAESLGYEGRESRLAETIPRHYDVAFMARKSLGRYWNKADEAGRARYLDAFRRFTIANYAGRFDGYSGQTFVTEGEEPARSVEGQPTVIVKSRLVDPGDEDVELDYRVWQVDGEWRVIDVYLDGTVSELGIRRSEFMSIVKREDLDSLVTALDEKIAKLAAGQGG